MHHIQMKEELNKIVNNLNSDEFQINLRDEIYSAAYLNFIRVKDFDPLFIRIHKEFNLTNKLIKQKKILDDEIAVYLALEKHLKKLIIGIRKDSLKIIIDYNADSKSIIDETLTSFFKIAKELSFEEKIKKQTINKLEKQLKETKQAVFELSNYQFATYQIEEFLGSNFYLRFPKEVIIYKEVNISNTRFGSTISFKDQSQSIDKITIINILAFLQAPPNFLLTKNKAFNEKLSTIYNEFDILDLFTLTSKKFFSDSESKFRSLSTPILKLHKETNFTILPEVNSEQLFDLYHSSLKQIEPLPRCVFLFRIIEYGKNHHYQKIFKSTNIELKDVIEYYYSEVIDHQFIPLFFLDYGTNWDSKTDSMIKKRKTQYLNLITELKKKSKQILKKWNSNSYLQTKSLGEIIYKTGRNTVAHGGNGSENINYDYANKYKHINDVNVFLELISRYLIEIHNPKLKNVVHRQKKIYEMNCSHMKIMKKKTNEIPRSSE